MDASEAREHIAMVERIIAASSRKLETGGEFFVVWGIAGALMDVVVTRVLAGLLPVAAMWINALLIVAAIVFTVMRSRYYKRCGVTMSLLQREYLNVLWLAMSLAFLSNVIGFNMFGPMAQIAMWNIVEAFVLLYIGMHGNRRAQIGAIVLIVSIALANFMTPYSGYILAAGVLFGYGGFGLADMLARE